jgi:hypothetical protein
MLQLDEDGHITDIVDETIDELKRKPYGHHKAQIIEEDNIEEMVESEFEEVDPVTIQSTKEEFIKSELNDKNAFIEASVAFMDFITIFSEVENHQLLKNEVNKIQEFLHISDYIDPSSFTE